MSKELDAKKLEITSIEVRTLLTELNTCICNMSYYKAQLTTAQEKVDSQTKRLEEISKTLKVKLADLNSMLYPPAPENNGKLLSTKKRKTTTNDRLDREVF